jgi:hypothetical protein
MLKTTVYLTDLLDSGLAAEQTDDEISAQIKERSESR